MSSEEHAELIAQAQAVLDGSRVGDYTKPAPHLYPHQWSWDSAFIAIGYAFSWTAALLIDLLAQDQDGRIA